LRVGFVVGRLIKTLNHYRAAAVRRVRYVFAIKAY